jgi:uncharacterized protein
VTARALEIETPEGLARAHVNTVGDPVGAVVLGHGAGGGVGTPDLVAATEAANEAGCTVVLVEQPYRVAGRKSQPPGPRMDSAWGAVVAALREDVAAGLPLIVGGRSAGARVACRTAAGSGAAGVLCLAFPVHAPGRPETAAKRLPELDGVAVPTLVVQGESDPFGMPPERAGRTVVTVAGNHGLKADLDAVGVAVRDWIPGVLAGARA